MSPPFARLDPPGARSVPDPGPGPRVDPARRIGRKVTSYHTIQTDLKNAGARWVDAEVVVDAGLVTSRNPGDLPAFNDKLVEEYREGQHEEQKRSLAAASV